MCQRPTIRPKIHFVQSVFQRGLPSVVHKSVITSCGRMNNTSLSSCIFKVVTFNPNQKKTHGVGTGNRSWERSEWISDFSMGHAYTQCVCAISCSGTFWRQDSELSLNINRSHLSIPWAILWSVPWPETGDSNCLEGGKGEQIQASLWENRLFHNLQLYPDKLKDLKDATLP
jgi:hypothetical protein